MTLKGYFAVILSKESQQFLSSLVPKGWEKVCHHMTVAYKPSTALYKQLIGKAGQPVILTTTCFGLSNKAMAVGVTGCHSNNSHPHVTVAVNPFKAGKPVDSNAITAWIPLEKFQLKGTFYFVPFK